MIRIEVKNAQGDEISGNVEVTDTDRIVEADGHFAGLVGAPVSSLYRLLKAWTNFDSRTPQNRKVINHCLGRKFLGEKSSTYSQSRGIYKEW